MTSTATENDITHDSLTLVRLDRSYDSAPAGLPHRMLPPGDDGNVFYVTRETGTFGDTYATIIIPESDPRSSDMWQASRSVYAAIPDDGLTYRGWNVPRSLLSFVEPDEEPAQTEVVAEGSVDYNVITPCFSLAEYKQRFRTIAFAGGHNNGVAIPPIEALLSKLQCPAPDVMPGIWWTWGDRDLRVRMPYGTTVEFGNREGTRGEYALVGINGGDDLRLFGRWDYLYKMGRVLTVPDVEGRAESVPGTADDLAQIMEFKAEAWALGVQAKETERWCPAYERTMHTAGITESRIEREGLTPQQVADLPVGTVLRPVESQSPSLYVRDDSSDNPAGTRGVIGEGHYAPLMTMESEPDADGAVHVQAGSGVELEEMPLGTLLTSGGRYVYERTSAGWYCDRSGEVHASTQFSVDGYYYIRIGS